MEDIRYTIAFGNVEPKTFNKFENGRMVTYGFSIHRDENGVETHRTKPSPLGSLGYQNGKPFTEREYNELTESEHCSGCGTRTGGGRCMTCDNQRQRELRGN